MTIDRTTLNRITEEINLGRKSEVRNVIRYGAPLALTATIFCPVGVLLWGGLWLTCYLKAKHGGDQRKINGASGEDRVQKLLLDLPEDFSVYNQIRFPCSYSSTGYREADFVVIGPNGSGIFIIENKDYSGRIRGNEGDDQWTLYKEIRGEWQPVKHVRNPVQQVRVYTRLLADIFRARGIKTWIIPIVTLSKDNGLFMIDSKKTPVVQAADICKQITEYNGSLSQENREKAIAVLEELRSGAGVELRKAA